MGANTSVQSVDTITKSVNNVLTQVSTQMENETESQQEVHQIMAMNISGASGCSVLANQEASVTANIVLNNSTEIANKMTNDLMTSIKKEIANQVSQVNEDLNLGQMNTSVMNTNSQTYVENNLSTLIETGIKNSVRIGQKGIQEMYFNISDITCGPTGMLEFNQKMLMETISKNISKNIVNNTIKNALTTDIKEKIDQRAEQANKGIDIFAMFTVFVIIGVIGLGGFLYLRTGGIAAAAEDQIRAVDVGAMQQQMMAAQGMYQQNMVGGFDDDDMLKVKLGLVCAGLIAGGYFGYYIPKKHEIKDNYDLSYLK